MLFMYEEAVELFDQLKEFTYEALADLAPSCPATTHKTRPWADEGEGGPLGMICHYTGGPDGLASTRWGNENPANKGSSWHMMVFDHRLTPLDSMLDGYPLVKQYFKVTVLFLGSLESSTWHGNWSNKYTFGIENRNLGRLAKKGDEWYRGKYLYKLVDRKGPPWLANGIWWEPYTRGQIAANVIIGQALRALQNRNKGIFVPQWILPHSAVWADKSDTGNAFPLFMVRASIFSDSNPHEQTWLQQFPGEYELTWWDDEELDESLLDLSRETPEPPSLLPDHNLPDTWRGLLPWVRWAFHQLGYHIRSVGQNIADMTNLDEHTELATRIFQKSTYAEGWTAKHGSLKVDGLPGEVTVKHIMHRLDDFKLEYASPL